MGKTKLYVPTARELDILDSLGSTPGGRDISADEQVVLHINSSFSKSLDKKGDKVIDKKKTIACRTKQMNEFFSLPYRMHYFETGIDAQGYPCINTKAGKKH